MFESRLRTQFPAPVVGQQQERGMAGRHGTVVGMLGRPEVREGEHPGIKAQARDTVRWRCPKTGDEHGDLAVEMVWTFRGAARVYGFFGRFRSGGGEIRTQRVVQLEDCVVTARAGSAG